MYSTIELQQEIIDYFTDNGITIKPLATKDDLTKVGTSPLSYIQFVSNSYKSGQYHSFNADFNLYFIDKTLSVGTMSELLELLDKARSLMIGARVEYKNYVSRENPVIITRETFTETNSSVFVYVMNISMKVRMKNANS